MTTRFGTPMNKNRVGAMLAALLATALLVAGCSSGSSGGATPTPQPPAPPPPPPPPPPPAEAPDAPELSLDFAQVKLFRFTWDDVEDETEYRLLESADGNAVYVEITELPADTESHDLEVFLPARVNASYILEACNDVGCSASAPVQVTGTLTEAIGYVKASNTRAQQFFGAAVAISGDSATLAIGAPGESSSATGLNGNQNDNSAPNAGAVYVFTREDAQWMQQAYIKASNTDPGDLFGSRVDLSYDGNTLAVAAMGEASGATGINGSQDNNVAPSSGAVYVFTRDGDVWSQQAYVKASNTAADDEFGEQVALSGSGDTLAVSTRLESGAATGINGDQSDRSAELAGAVYVFVREGGVWSQQAYIKASNTEAFDQFGYSLALSRDGDTLAAGARFESSAATGIDGDQSDNSSFGAGAVYVFTRDAGVWSQQAYIKASNADTAGNIGFGWSVALSANGDTLAVGAALEDSGAIGINGNQNDLSAERSGAVYLFDREAGVWSQQAYIKASNTHEDANFGSVVQLTDDGETLVVSALREQSNASGIGGDQTNRSTPFGGAAYLFARDAGQWSQTAYVKAAMTQELTYFGVSISIDSAGDTLAVGAAGESSAATGIGGDQEDLSEAFSGAVYLY